MRDIGVDIRLVGVLTLAQAPWTFKILWAPLMDRYAPPWWGRRRGWISIAQVALMGGGILLAGQGGHPDTPWIIGALALAIALASATQDVALDGYAVELLHKDEQAVAVGARIAVYRAAMALAGALAITLAGRFSWPMVNLFLASLYLPMIFLTWKSPEPDEIPAPPKTMKEAIWLPFLGFLSRYRALEILAFVVFYKLADNLGGALLRPFLIDMGYTSDDRGIGLLLAGLPANLIGTFIGGVCTSFLGLGRALWFFGFLQIFSNIGYVLIADSEINRTLMFGAIGFETLTQGMGTGAFSVLLLRMTNRKFSVTQYALFSSLFASVRVFSGPISGFMVDALGWVPFFWITIAAGIPGLVLLQRFVPWGVREPEFYERAAPRGDPCSATQVWIRGGIGFVLGLFVAIGTVALLAYLKALRLDSDPTLGLGYYFQEALLPTEMIGWIQFVGAFLASIILGLLTAAYFAAKNREG